jgi:hypothetical protein
MTSEIDPRQVGLKHALEIVDLPAPTALNPFGIEPVDPDQHVDGTDITLGLRRRNRGPGHARA